MGKGAECAVSTRNEAGAHASLCAPSSVMTFLRIVITL
jgi:hypothetical protein